MSLDQTETKKVKASFLTITESGIEPRELLLDLKDFGPWMKKLDCEEKDACELLTRELLKGKTECLNIYPIFNIFLKLAEN